jgi:hypothetical protein
MDFKEKYASDLDNEDDKNCTDSNEVSKSEAYFIINTLQD